MTQAFTARSYPSLIEIKKDNIIVSGGIVDGEDISEVLVFNAINLTAKKIADLPFSFHCPNQTYAEGDDLIMSLVRTKNRGACFLEYSIKR